MNLSKNVLKAYEELKAIGAPVMHLGGGFGGDALFAISAEENYDYVWADYYAENEFPGMYEGYEFGVSPKINKILNKHGLFCEWYNAGVLDVSVI